MEVSRHENVSVERLSIAFDGLHAVSNLSFDLPAGSIVALIGPNGAGKTTVFNLICGYLKPDSGTILLGEEDVTGQRPEYISLLGVGRTFQDCKVFEQLSVLDNVRLGLRDRRHETMASALWQGKGLRKGEEQRQERAVELLEEAGLADKIDSLAGDLSYGQRKLLELCRVRAFAPELYMLDEPFSGLFPDMAKRMAKVICDLHKNGKTVIFIEHDMQAVLDIANRVIVLDFGRKIADDTPKEALNDPAVLDAYLGRVAQDAT